MLYSPYVVWRLSWADQSTHPEEKGDDSDNRSSGFLNKTTEGRFGYQDTGKWGEFEKLSINSEKIPGLWWEFVIFDPENDWT